MRFSSGTKSRELLVELTPMIDVVFLLIIFFMVTSEFARDVRAEVELPKLPGEQREENEEAGVVVNIDENGNIILSVSEEPVTLEELRKQLQVFFITDNSTEQRVLLRADRRASAGRL
ncbi:MAG: biopolymer transporter ExbD, partial [Planctomycetota bacterium]|nr:biopolymer transporter ExbD [Planctomycetota bacterium]